MTMYHSFYCTISLAIFTLLLLPLMLRFSYQRFKVPRRFLTKFLIFISFSHLNKLGEDEVAERKIDSRSKEEKMEFLIFFCSCNQTELP